MAVTTFEEDENAYNLSRFNLNASAPALLAAAIRAVETMKRGQIDPAKYADLTKAIAQAQGKLPE